LAQTAKAPTPQVPVVDTVSFPAACQPLRSASGSLRNKTTVAGAVVANPPPPTTFLPAGQEAVTSKMVRQRLQRRGISVETLEALNILYVLVALGKARVDRRRSQTALFFNVAA